MWLRDETMPDDWRPDRAHVYVSGDANDDVLKVFVDADYPDAWKTGQGQEVIENLNDKHVLVVVDRQITFLPSPDKATPEKLIVEWLL